MPPLPLSPLQLSRIAMVTQVMRRLGLHLASLPGGPASSHLGRRHLDCNSVALTDSPFEASNRLVRFARVSPPLEIESIGSPFLWRSSFDFGRSRPVSCRFMPEEFPKPTTRRLHVNPVDQMTDLPSASA